MTEEFKRLQGAAFAALVAIEEKQRGFPLKPEERLTIFRERIDGLDGEALMKLAPGFKPTAPTTPAKPTISEADAAAWIRDNRPFLNGAAKLTLAREIMRNGAFPTADPPREARSDERARDREVYARRFRDEQHARAKSFGHN